MSNKENLKEFYGKFSIAARVGFAITEKDKETAEDIVFEDVQGMEIILKDGSKLEITDIEWNQISESERGNVSQPYIDDFEIEEEK